ncbi:unnamed protein product, partial [Closterium sp. Naga37s-1]
QLSGNTFTGAVPIVLAHPPQLLAPLPVYLLHTLECSPYFSPPPHPSDNSLATPSHHRGHHPCGACPSSTAHCPSVTFVIMSISYDKKFLHSLLPESQTDISPIVLFSRPRTTHSLSLLSFLTFSPSIPSHPTPCLPCSLPSPLSASSQPTSSSSPLASSSPSSSLPSTSPALLATTTVTAATPITTVTPTTTIF